VLTHLPVGSGAGGEPLAKLWTRGLPALSTLGAVAMYGTQNATTAKHRGTQGWLRAAGPENS